MFCFITSAGFLIVAAASSPKAAEAP